MSSQRYGSSRDIRYHSHLFYEKALLLYVTHHLDLLVIRGKRGVHWSYSDPWVTDEILDRDERVVAHVWVWVCHEFHRSCFGTQICDNSRNPMSIWRG